MEIIKLMKKKKLLNIFILLLFAINLNAQYSNQNLLPLNFSEIEKGTPYFSYFSSNFFAGKDIFSLVQDKKGQILIANRRGIFIYNANTYSFVETSGMPVKLTLSPNNDDIYVTCNNSFGVLNSTDSSYFYTEIAKVNNNFTGKTDIYFDSNKIYFDYRSFIAVFDTVDVSVKYIYPPENETFGGVIKMNNQYNVLVNGIGFYSIQNDSLSKDYYPFDEVDIISSLNNSSVNVFIASDNELYYVDNESITQVKDKALEYFDDKIISGAVIVGQNQIAIYSLNGGIVFFDTEKQKITSVMNTFTGLPENEVLAMVVDNNGGLWVVNNFGLFRYDFSLPITNYASFPGLEGKILSSQMLDTTLYVLTTQGIYYLTKPKSDQEFQDYVQKQQARAVQSSVVIQNVNSQAVVSNIADDVADDIADVDVNSDASDNQNIDNSQQKNNVFKRWSRKIFRKKNNNQDQQTNTDTDTNNVVSTDTTNVVSADTATQVEPVQHTTYVPHYTHRVAQNKKQFSELYFIFKKVDGINSKCKKSVKYNGNLYIASNSGLFYVSDNEAVPIIKDEYITEIQQSTLSENILYVASTSTLYKIDMSLAKPHSEKILDLSTLNDYIFSIAETETALWLGGEGFAYQLDKYSSDITMYPVSPDFLPTVKVLNLNENIFCYTPQGIYKYNKGLDSVVEYMLFNYDDSRALHFIKSENDIIWYKNTDFWSFQSANHKVDIVRISFLNIIQGIQDIKIDDDDNLWVVSGNNLLYKISSFQKDSVQLSFNLFLDNISINNANETVSSDIIIPYKENLIAKFELSAPFYIQNKDIQYQYSVSLKEDNFGTWSDLSNSNIFQIPLVKGEQFIHFRAKNVLNQYSNVISVKINVKPPFWDTAWFNFLIILGVFIIVSLLALIRQKALKMRNLELENQVKLRTAEVEQQNDELKAQRDELKAQSELVIEQRDKIQKTNDYVTQSINYARRIQKAILPAGKILLSYFSDYMILSKPRDIVSGDFYWTKEQNNKLYLAVADCTGHGVPGGFLSMLGSAFLNEIITYKENLNSALIVNSLRQSIIYALQEKESNSVRDGMDISFVIYDKENMTIEFTGAYQSMYLLRQGEIIIYKGDRMPVGYSRQNNVPFTKQLVNVQKDDIIYLFTDGYADQFGEKEHTKFMLFNFRRLITTIGDVPLNIQNELFAEAFKDWKGKTRQIDDVTVVAVKI